jgi:ATP-dependent helicase Lhr and Lhr-like helicase
MSPASPASPAFTRLAPFIQQYIYNNGWDSLRPVQEAACQVVFDSDAHLLVAAGTAAGKTEAAFLPVLTELYNDPPTTIGALYIGPIKALINDQFDRLNELLQYADIPVAMWHGDVKQSAKKRVLKQPQGILQITPESLESLLINKRKDLMRLFGDLRFVVIDEVHSFIGGDRGAQLLCQLTRLARLTQHDFRRIGLSATLGDYGLAEAWLSAGTQRSTITPQVPSAARTLRLGIEHFYDQLVVRAQGDSRDEAFNPYHRHLFNQSLNRKCLIFANGRTETERIIRELKIIADSKGEPDIYHVHHGSIAAPLREKTEALMRGSDQPMVTAATVTFEMGIDLGQLDRVIQLEAPGSVASFLQRLGRSGRRGTPADMRFVCLEEKPLEAHGDTPLPDLIPWQLLQCIAILQLYLEEKWIEPNVSARYPYHLLYQQTMSILAAGGEMSPPQLAQAVLTLPPFQHIGQEDFRDLLRHLIALDHIEKTPEGQLIIGVTGEKQVGSFKFYAIFPDQESYTVRHEDTEIGCVSQAPCIGDRISLAGLTWQVTSVQSKGKLISVVPGSGAVMPTVWRGGSGEIHSRILQRMRQVLLEEKEYSYLLPGAKARLNQAREVAQDRGLANFTLFHHDENSACLLPWVGSAAFRTLERYLRLHCRETLKIKGVRGKAPYFLVINLGKATLPQLSEELKSLGDRRFTPEELIKADETPRLQKYDEFVPEELLRKAFAQDYLDLETLKAQVRTW